MKTLIGNYCVKIMVKGVLGKIARLLDRKWYSGMWIAMSGNGMVAMDLVDVGRVCQSSRGQYI